MPGTVYDRRRIRTRLNLGYTNALGSQQNKARILLEMHQSLWKEKGDWDALWLSLQHTKSSGVWIAVMVTLRLIIFSAPVTERKQKQKTHTVKYNRRQFSKGWLKKKPTCLQHTFFMGEKRNRKKNVPFRCQVMGGGRFNMQVLLCLQNSKDLWS